MANPSVTYTFINTQVSDGPQVSTNFTDLINALTDGSKDLSIMNLTVAGTLAVTGATTHTGVIKAPNGTVLLPSYTFTTELSSGMFLNATGDVRITAAGVLAASFKTSGLVTAGVAFTSTGSVSAPGYIFVSTEATTGLYRAAANTIGFTVSGVTVGNVSANGWVLQGTITNDSAATGILGEHVTASVAATNVVAGSGAFENATSISLTAGDWDVSGGLHHILNGATVTGIFAAISVNTGNTTTDHVSGANQFSGLPPSANVSVTLALIDYRISIATTTTVYLKSRVDYSAGTPRYLGTIRARRVR